MNRVVTFVGAALLSCAAAMAAGPRVTWLDSVHDFGAFNEELGLVRCTFKAINTGTEPLTVISARANCGCTRPQYTVEPVVPGDTLTISVAYDAKGRPGKFEKKVFVSTNDGATSTLKIVGTVIGASNSLQGRYPVESGMARLNTSVMPFGEVMKGHTAGSVVRGYNPTNDTIRPLAADVPDYITVLFQPAAVPPGEPFVISATATTAGTPDWGYVTDSLTFRADPRSPVATPLSTVLIIREDFSTLTPEQIANGPKAEISTKLIDLGHVDRDSQPSTHSFTIANPGKEPLMIRRVDTPDPAVSVKLASNKVKPGGKTTVTLRVDPSKLGKSNLLNARITVITNDPEHAQNMVRVVGQP